MAKYPDFHTPEGIVRRFAEGRGTGRGPTYRPFFTRFDVRSYGERRETYCAKCDRGVHVLSRLEYYLVLLAEADPAVIDIREQFPLPLHETEVLAAALDIRHPRYWTTGCNLVMTTDLLLTKQDGSGTEYTEAWSGKYASALGRWRTREKLFLEAKWHEQKGHRWYLKTEQDIPPLFISNLAWLHPLRRRDAMLGYSQDLAAKVDEVMRGLMKTSTDLLWRLAQVCDRKIGHGDGPTLYVCRYLLASSQWRADLRSWDRSTQPLILQS